MSLISSLYLKKTLYFKIFRENLSFLKHNKIINKYFYILKKNYDSEFIKTSFSYLDIEDLIVLNYHSFFDKIKNKYQVEVIKYLIDNLYLKRKDLVKKKKQ